MTFDKDYWAKADVGYSYAASQIFTYISSTDALATIVASGYFNDLANEDNLRQYDYIIIKASDDVGLYHVTSVTGATPVTVASIIDSSIIPDGAVTKPKLAAGVQPSHIIKYAGEHTTVGGAAAEAITVTGALATDLVFCQLHTVGGTPRTILTAVASADTVTVTFSGDPSTDHVVAYQVVRVTT